MNLIVVFISTVLQFTAGFLALRLIVDTGRSWAWTLLSAGIFAMAFRRTHTLYLMFQNGDVPSLPYESLGLVVSMLILFGVSMIAPMIRDMRTVTDKLVQSEERYRTVARFTHDWEYWLSPDDRYLYVSPACEKITGYAPEDFKNDPKLFRRLIHPNDREMFLNKTSSVENLRHPMRFDCRIVDKSGTVQWVAYNSLPVYSSGGVYLGVRASVRDINHRKRLEEQLRESRLLYQGVIENSRTMILRLDSTGVVTFANQFSVEQLCGAESDIVNRRFQDFLLDSSGATDRILAERLEKFFHTGDRLEIEVEMSRPGGSVFWVEWGCSGIRNVEGELAEFICVGMDVTKRKALDKLKENVTRIIRHDLKSPLSGIIGIPRLLRREDNITPRQAELLKAVEDAATIMLELLNQSVNLYKLEAGTYQFNIVEFDLVELFNTVLKSIQLSYAHLVPVEITINGKSVGPEEKMMIQAEQPLIFSLFCNLLRNALEASDGCPVVVDMNRNDKCTVVIRNTGVVPVEIRETFFEKYVTEGKPGGTGLGTYSALLIAQSHGGDISMRSSDKEGTEVTVWLPLSTECGSRTA